MYDTNSVLRNWDAVCISSASAGAVLGGLLNSHIRTSLESPLQAATIAQRCKRWWEVVKTAGAIQQEVVRQSMHEAFWQMLAMAACLQTSWQCGHFSWPQDTSDEFKPIWKNPARRHIDVGMVSWDHKEKVRQAFYLCVKEQQRIKDSGDRWRLINENKSDGRCF